MAQTTDSSSRIINRQFQPSASCPTQESGLDIEDCLQDLDLSCTTAVARREVCNLGCSNCAIRWSRRRYLEQLHS